MRHLFPLILALLLLGCSDSSDSHHSAPGVPPLGPEVVLDSGMVRGQEHPESTVWEWLGIPFAAPPVGDLRWKAPRPVEAWAGVRDTVTFGSECTQIRDAAGTVIGDEDCLHLNVWRPRSGERDLPVYVWIHGGSNTWGANNWSSYQGDRLAQRSNMVVVSIQYRLGPLGWLYFDPLHSGDALDDSGNYGLLDIISSLEWIQHNIEAFGGDPGNVIITGESAGAVNIMSLLVSELAAGLFHKAIIQSAMAQDSSPEEGNTEASKMVDNLLESGGADWTAVDVARILREAPAADIIAAFDGPSRAVRDGAVLPAAGVTLLETGDHSNKVPIIVGTNKDEAKLYTNPLTASFLPSLRIDISQFSEEVREGAGRYISDLWRVHGADQFATDILSAPDQPDVYVYRFNWGSPNEEGLSPLPLDFGATLGAHHSMEITFVLGNWEQWVDPRGTPRLFTPESAQGRENLSNAIMTYFAAFARSGNPNGDNLTTWEPFSAEPGFKAIEFDVDLLDNSAKLTADTRQWTVDDVLADLEANVVEPTKSVILLILRSVGLI